MNHQRAQSRKPQAAKSASDTVVMCWVTGVLLLLVGIAIIAFSMPGAETGSAVGFLLGLFLAGIGQIVVFVAIIATGVRLGMSGQR